MDYQVAKIGLNKGALRVWLQGQRLERAGFKPATQFTVEKQGEGLIIRAAIAGNRAVTGTEKAGKIVPIIDLNSRILDVFEGLENVKVIYQPHLIQILPVASEARTKERKERLEKKLAAGEPLKMASLAHGIGVMDDALATGMHSAGLDTALAVCNELRDELVEHGLTIGREITTDTITLTGSMTEFGFDPALLASLGKVDILSAGISCKGASVAGRAKNKHEHPEAHPEAGHLVLAFISILSFLNPSVVVLENVESYANTASMCLIRNQLAEFGYNLHETVLNGEDFDAFERRKRFVMVAVTKGMDFSFDALEYPAVRTDKKLAEILDDVPDGDASWSAMEGLKAKEIRDKEAGKGFAMQIFTGESDHIKTLTAGIAKVRSTDPKIQHPNNADLLRIPTLNEHAKAKGVPLDMIAGVTSKTLGHIMLGQSVIYPKFVAVGRAIAATLQQWICQQQAQAQEPEFQLMPC